MNQEVRFFGKENVSNSEEAQVLMLIRCANRKDLEELY